MCFCRHDFDGNQEWQEGPFSDFERRKTNRFFFWRILLKGGGEEKCCYPNNNDFGWISVPQFPRSQEQIITRQYIYSFAVGAHNLCKQPRKLRPRRFSGFALRIIAPERCIFVIFQRFRRKKCLSSGILFNPKRIRSIFKVEIIFSSGPHPYMWAYLCISPIHYGLMLLMGI